MKIAEVTNAEDQLALWRLVSDNVWRAIDTQAAQERAAKAERAARSTAKRPKRRAAPSSPKAAIAPAPKPAENSKQTVPKPAEPTQQQKAAQPASTTTLPPAQTGPFGATGNSAAPALPSQPTVQPANAALPAQGAPAAQRPNRLVARAKPHLSARAGGLVI
jgi:hypothetical protein